MAQTFDTKALIAAATTNPQAANYTCGAGATLLVVTLIYANGTRTGGAPTYNAVALTQADQVRNAASSPEACAELWYMLSPPTGSAYSVSVPNANGLSLEVCIASYKATSGWTSLFDNAAGNQNNGSANPAVSVTPKQDNCLIVAVAASGHDTFAPSARAGTSLYETDNGTWGGGHQYFVQTTAAAKSMSWTQGSDDWGACAASFKEVGIGLNVSKSNVLAIVRPEAGISSSKANIYAVLSTMRPGINVSKANIYAVLLVSATAKTRPLVNPPMVSGLIEGGLVC